MSADASCDTEVRLALAIHESSVTKNPAHALCSQSAVALKAPDAASASESLDAETEVMMGSWSKNLVLSKRGSSFMSDRVHSSCLSLLDQVRPHLDTSPHGTHRKSNAEAR